MNITLADQYYLKALDEYPYNFEETVENLNYALSYDNEHAGANYLMGRLYMEHFKQFEKAEICFIAAMTSDPHHIDTCESFTWLLIKIRKFKEARRLINHAYNLKGVKRPVFMRLEALTYELSMEFGHAKTILNQAMLECYDSSQIIFFEEEIKRITKKQGYANELHYKIIV